MIVYIIRHGDPDYEHDTITPYGQREAQALAQWFDQIPLDEIYTSPLGRAKDTAAYTASRQHLTPKVLPWMEESMDYMRPYTPSDDCTYRFTTQDGVVDFQDYHTEDRCEILEQLISSSDAFFAEHGYKRVGAHYHVTDANNKRIALFCHGGFGTALTAHLLGMPPALGFLSMFMTTTGVTTIEFCDNDRGYLRPRMLRFSDISHLHAQHMAEDRI